MATAYPYTLHVEEDSIDAALSTQLVLAAFNQIMFLKSQLPMPISRLSLLPIKPNDKLSKKRTEFLKAHDELQLDLLSANRGIAATFRTLRGDEHIHSNIASSQFLCVFGAPSVARASLALEISGLKLPPKSESEPLAQTPPDSESEEEADNSSEHDEDEKPFALRSRSTQPPVFTPFSDDEEANDIKSSQNTSPHTPNRTQTSLRPNSIQAGESNGLPVSPTHGQPFHGLAPYVSSPAHYNALNGLNNENVDENNVQRAKKRQAVERKLCLEMATTPGMLEEIDPAKIHIYIRAPREFEHSRWIPKTTATGKLDTLLSTALIETVPASSGPNKNISKKSNVKVFGFRILATSAIDQEPQLPGSKIHVQKTELFNGGELYGEDGEEGKTLDDLDHEADEMIWFQWAGKMTGIGP